MASRSRREYLQLLDASKVAAEAALDAFNSPWHRYRNETSLILLSNAWELLAKAVLLLKKESISKGSKGETISAEVAVHRLLLKKLIEEPCSQIVQQIISLRNAACHGVLPPVPPEVMQHLLFFACKGFRDLLQKNFPQHAKSLSESYLSISFTNLTTYADKIQRCVARVRTSGGDKKLVWLLERGISFDGTSYISETKFERKYKGRKRVLPHLDLSKFLKSTDMVRIVPIEAPRNFTADLSLRKGNSADASLPVVIKKTDIEADYPHLTKELAAHIGKGQNWAAKAVASLGLKGDPKYHQPIRASSSSVIHRYSNAALQLLKDKLVAEPTYTPYRTPTGAA